MLIHSLHLKNIRSYVDEEITLPEGRILLAGDIGSGKSTILLALEFALFGIQRGELSGSSLLRHGSRTGSVTLNVRIANKDVSITRALKRTDNGVNQGTGSLTVDGFTTELTAQELKSKVLELLSYPQSLLKGKGPLFRYTVYTPQEEMKAILSDDADSRLDTLRKLFDIDKYKRIRENALLLLRDLRREETDLKARAEELSKELGDEVRINEELKKATTSLAAQEEAAKRAKTALDERRKLLEALERERFAAEETKKQHAVVLARLENARQRRQELGDEHERYAKQISETEGHLSPLDVDEQKLKEEERLLTEKSSELKRKETALLKREATLEATITKAQTTIQEIDSLTDCPTCKQPVTEEHKEHIRQDEEKESQKRG